MRTFLRSVYLIISEGKSDEQLSYFNALLRGESVRPPVREDRRQAIVAAGGEVLA